MTFFVEGVSKHLEPEPQVRRIGEYETVAEAIAVAQKAIEQFLRGEFKRGMDAKKLFSLYEERGEHTFIFQDEAKTFNVPGMQVNAEIHLGTRSALEYLLSPVQEVA